MGNMKMKKIVKKIVFISTIFFLFILNTLTVNAETYYINNSSKTDLLYRLSNARDGDIIVLNSDISLYAGSNGNGGNADNFGIKANSALLIKNGTVQTIDTNNSDTGILILDNVKVTNIMYLGNTQAWIVNGSYIAKLNVEQGKYLIYQATILAGDKTAYVDFKIKQIYDIGFHTNGGKGSMLPISTKEETYSLPECTFIPPLNKEFAGWSYSPHGEVIATREIVLKDDTVLYARWNDHKHRYIVKNIGDNIKKYSCHCGHYYFMYN